MNLISTVIRMSKAAASFYANSSTTPVEMVACMKMVIVSFYLAATGAMFHGNDEWDVIIACTLGGFPGAVIGVFLAMFDVKNAEWKWHVYFLRWAVNMFSGTLLGPAVYKWTYPMIFKDPNSAPSPILALACGGTVGAVFLLLAQPFIPSLRRMLDKRAEKIIVG